MGSDANRARRLGDVGANDPSRWQWGAGARVPHVLVMLYALPGQLEASRQRSRRNATPASSAWPA